MYKVIVFAGTTEGYGLCRFLGENQIPVLAVLPQNTEQNLFRRESFFMCVPDVLPGLRWRSF